MEGSDVVLVLATSLGGGAAMAAPVVELAECAVESTGDGDADGIPDAQEVCLGLNPYHPDTDRDGRTDGAEACPGPLPCATPVDSDGDDRMDALDDDDDGDGLPSLVEGWWDMDLDDVPCFLDTDSDGQPPGDAAERDVPGAACAVTWGEQRVADSDCDGAPDVIDSEELATLAPPADPQAVCGCDGGAAGATWLALGVGWLTRRRRWQRGLVGLAVVGCASTQKEGTWYLEALVWDDAGACVIAQIANGSESVELRTADAGFEMITWYGQTRCDTTDAARLVCEPQSILEMEIADFLPPAEVDGLDTSDPNMARFKEIYEDNAISFAFQDTWTWSFVGRNRAVVDLESGFVCLGEDCELFLELVNTQGMLFTDLLFCTATASTTARWIGP